MDVAFGQFQLGCRNPAGVGPLESFASGRLMAN